VRSTNNSNYLGSSKKRLSSRKYELGKEVQSFYIPKYLVCVGNIS
jgi:hypothetical protein